MSNTENTTSAVHTTAAPITDAKAAIRIPYGREATVYVAGGCFWGVEAYFRRVPGILKVTVGYANGKTENPSYEDVCRRDTGTPKRRLLPLIRPSSRQKKYGFISSVLSTRTP